MVFIVSITENQNTIQMKKIAFSIALIGALLLHIYTRSNTNNEYVNRAEQLSECNFDFRHASNMAAKERIDYTKNTWKPKSCINTATAIFDENNTCTYCPHFVEHPEKWNFKEVETPEPGDIIVFFNKNRAFHAGVIVKNSLLGPIMNHANGGFRPNTYRHHDPVCIFSLLCGTAYVKYYRYNKALLTTNLALNTKRK